MANLSCLVCLEEDPGGLQDLFHEKNKSLKAKLQEIVRRKVQKDRVENRTRVCDSCIAQVRLYMNLEHQIASIASVLRHLFGSNYPLKKKGRPHKPKCEVKVESDEPSKPTASEPRKSQRERKAKKFHDDMELDAAVYLITGEDTENESAREAPSKAKSGMKTHQDTTAILSSMATKCPHCDFESDSIVQIERHLKNVHSSEADKLYACELCGKSFVLKSNLALHQKTHDLERPFSCDKCEKTYKQRNSLREHVLKSHDNISKFTCQFCPEKFPSRHLLKIHERSHTGEGKFVCDECGDSFGGKQALHSHMSKHNGTYNFKCKICKKGFNCKTMMFEHTLTHSGEKPFECDKCGKKFSNRGTLWHHKKQHENTKPYQCSICTKAFKHASHLAVHKRLHTGEKPYKCRFCAWSSPSATNLKVHMKNHDNKKAFGCRQCSMDFDLKIDLAKHCNDVHKGVVLLEECSIDEEIIPVSTKPSKHRVIGQRITNDNTETTYIEYVVNEDATSSNVTTDAGQHMEPAAASPTSDQQTQYTVVNISDVSAFQNAHTTVVQDDNCKVIQNEDGTTTLITAGDQIGEIDGKTVLLVRLPDAEDTVMDEGDDQE